MNIKELIELLQGIPEHLQRYPVLIEAIPEHRVSGKIIIAPHFNLFFIESTSHNIFGHEIRAQSVKKSPSVD